MKLLFVTLLCFLNCISNINGIKVHRAHPFQFGSNGGAKLWLFGEDLVAEKLRIHIGSNNETCNLDHLTSDPDGKWVSCIVPALLPGEYQVSITQSNEVVVPSQRSKILIDAKFNSEGTSHFGSTISACAGDTLHFSSTSNDDWKIANSVEQIELFVGGKPVHMHNRHTTRHRVPLDDDSLHQLHIRVPNGLTAGLHPLEVNFHSTPSEDFASGKVRLDVDSVLVKPSITDVFHLKSTPQMDQLRIVGTGFSLNKSENTVHWGNSKPCKILESDFHHLLVECKSLERANIVKSETEEQEEQEDIGIILKHTHQTNEEEWFHVKNELEWPVQDPLNQEKTEEQILNTNGFTVTAQNSFFVPPKSGNYSFHCSNCQHFQILNRENGSFFEQGTWYPIKLEFSYAKENNQLKVSAILDNQKLQVVPAIWFKNRRPILKESMMRVYVNEHRAICRSKVNCKPNEAFENHGEFVDPENHSPKSLIQVQHGRNLQDIQIPSNAVRLSEWVDQVGCQDCVIPENLHVVVDRTIELRSITVKGKLELTMSRFTESNIDVSLIAGFIVAETGGEIVIDAQDDPQKRAIVYIKANGAAHHALGERSFGSWHDRTISNREPPSVRVQGNSIDTWSTLNENAEQGATEITLAQRVSDLGWRVGDRIAIAPSGIPATSRNFFKGPEVFEIGSINKNKITFANGAALSQKYLGLIQRKLVSEVINLSRNVIITGDEFSRQIGLQTVAQNGGSFQITGTRIEKCGQRGIVGKYCLHFHLMGNCPSCIFRGNAIEDSHQRGIIIHGTHRGTVESNVLFKIRGAGIYVEDGNEMENLIKNNVNICHQSASNPSACKAPGTDNEFADDVHQTGLWSISMTNDYIGNRMINHENGLFTTVTAFPFGRGAAAQKVCTIHAPFGRIEGNVQHSNWRFGFYLDNNWPRNIERSVDASNGLVVDMDQCWHASVEKPCSCSEFKKDGSSNGKTGYVVDIVDFGNDFVGQYELGDVQYLGHYSVNNLKNLYWKHTKNFADGETTAHIKDSTYGWFSDLNMPGYPIEGPAHILGPGGLGAFVIENTKFFGRVHDCGICSNQHCSVGPGTGGLCTPTYTFVDVDFSEMGPNSRWIQFGVSDGNPELPMFSSMTGPIHEDYVSVASRHMDYLLAIPGNVCTRSSDLGLAHRFNDGILCKKPLRRLQVWSANQGAVFLNGPGGGTLSMPFIAPCPGGSSCYYKQGYGAVVIPGFQYALSGLNRNFRPNQNSPAVTIEFSDPVFGSRFPLDEIDLLLNDEGLQCKATSLHDRKFVDAHGPFKSDRGACSVNDNVSPTVPTKSPTDGPVTPTMCPGPFFDHPECESRIVWMLENWNKVDWKDVYMDNGVDGSRCSIQNYLSKVENYCPPLVETTPSSSPSSSPSVSPTIAPSFSPTIAPSASPTKLPSFSPSTSPTNSPTIGKVEKCTGPYPNFPECEPRIAWMVDNWDKVDWKDQYIENGIDGSRCSIQHYLATVETFCPPIQCLGPYPDFPECESRIVWMVDNWDKVDWKDQYIKHGVDGSRCSIQHYLAIIESYCPAI